MFTMRRLIIVATAAALMTGCASQNPYDNQVPSPVPPSTTTTVARAP